MGTVVDMDGGMVKCDNGRGSGGNSGFLVIKKGIYFCIVYIFRLHYSNLLCRRSPSERFDGVR